MEREELLAYWLTDRGLAFFRKTIVDHYAWFTHEAPFDRVDGIRKDGLQPRNPGCTVPQIVRKAFGDVNGIVCLNPVGSQGARSSSTGKLFRVGFRAVDLPQRVGLDWSYPDSSGLRNISRAQIECWGTDGALLYVVDQTGAVASYCPVRPSLLRVCTHGRQGTFPSTWQMLTGVQNDEVATFNRAI